MHNPLTALTERLEIVELSGAAAARTFAEDVASGLGAARKRLPSKYFYDDLGSALFDAITKLPEYYLTGAETEILRESGWEIVRVLEEPVEFFELGSGSAVKTRLLIEEALRAQTSLRYSPIDISIDALRASSASLVDSYPTLSIRAYAGDYFSVLRSGALRFKRRVLAMLMGSNIGNYQPSEAERLLGLTARALRPGDGLLLGVDWKKDRTALELAYDDPTGVTAAFNKNMLARINRELGGAFDLHAFDHVARYDEKRGAVDSSLRARAAMDVPIDALGRSVHFEAGEAIHTESSYKFDEARIAELAANTGFSHRRTWHDRGRRFGVALLIREG
ncbi:MAG TPA: L-histidine N(alpha)-methyltransferase [Candidatus Baltobacteraceae bacterium]|jgi:dimethylhistidine N-methyltransferase|nr:L-histidine N(alpha)-methyltransferase [Candidatus Baltobacteraceae bacterium]